MPPRRDSFVSSTATLLRRELKLMSSCPDRDSRLAEILADMVCAALAWEAQHAVSGPYLENVSNGLTLIRRPVHNGKVDGHR